MAKKPSQTLTIAEQESWLIARGWGRMHTRSPWCWWKKPFRGTFFRLKDAVELERSYQTGKS